MPGQVGECSAAWNAHDVEAILKRLDAKTLGNAVSAHSPDTLQRSTQ
jgi:hypothetical protein